MARELNEHFELIRRNSLRNEMESAFGAFDELDDEDTAVDAQVTHSECMMLHRVLSDKTKIPRACGASTALTNMSASNTAQMQMQQQQPHDRVPQLVRRLSGGVPGAFAAEPSLPKKQELGGPVSYNECQTLAAFLRPSVGGAYLLPNACSSMLRRAQEQEKADTYQRDHPSALQTLTRRMTKVATEAAKEDWPPTFV